MSNEFVYNSSNSIFIDSNLTIKDSRFIKNWGIEGGVIYVENCHSLIQDSDFEENEAEI